MALKWGICAAGKISNDFVLSLNALSDADHKICAVAASDLGRAKAFAKTHNILKAYSSYEELAADKDVGIVYIGNLNTQHFSTTKLMLSSGKHVLCEKPLAVNVNETKALFKIAKAKNLFLMEAIWSRCFPAYHKVQELLDSDVIGTVNHVQAHFGEVFEPIAPRILSRDQAGGALLDRGIYPVQFAQFVFKEKPLKQSSHASLTETGVDETCHIFLTYSNERTAFVSTSFVANFPNEAVICGTKGTIKVCFPLWCPNKVELIINYGEPEVFQFDLPARPTYADYNFRNSEGLQYEAEEVRRCINEGLIESPLVTSEMSIGIAQIIENARKEIGYSLPQDDVDCDEQSVV
ncbi:trans-1,2-dihydrobenzene-1,2-diol dehydrogenase-like [Clavelina lepadiformis]|uniref:Trans-1,2-dihydrobenzene-1,2-diol dehydrogenase n=1 Tax=Clavelina lepadiformis TaxID=159417 RepID=A0ABP0FJS2_CLALP